MCTLKQCVGFGVEPEILGYSKPELPACRQAGTFELTRAKIEELLIPYF